MFPKFVDAPDTPILNLLFLMFRLDVLYIRHNMSFTIRTAKAAPKLKGLSTDTKNTGIPHCDLIRSILRRCVNANAKLVS